MSVSLASSMLADSRWAVPVMAAKMVITDSHLLHPLPSSPRPYQITKIFPGIYDKNLRLTLVLSILGHVSDIKTKHSYLGTERPR